MPIIFDGRAFAQKILSELKVDRPVKLAIIYNPTHEPSRVYTKVKIKAAERLGIKILKYEQANADLLKKLNADPEVTGILIQHPFPNEKKLIATLDPKKDVDGLRADSPFLPATVRAVLAILKSQAPNPSNVLVVGSHGQVGSRLVKELNCACMDKEDFDLSAVLRASVVISTTGSPGLIKDVKEGAVCIDVGYPKGDFAPEVAPKASFFTPVPGGVGPVTVAMLFANLLETGV